MIVAVAVIALIVLVLVPFIRWRTEHFVITNHHVFFRTGLLSRREHQIPLGQIANMETEVTFWGRLMGYGSLIVESSADQPLKFRNVASLSKVQAQLNQLIRDEREATHHRRDEPRGYQQGPPHAGLPPQQYQQAPAKSIRRRATRPRAGTRSRATRRQPDPQAYAQHGYQPTQAYQQPPGYPPAGTQAAYPQQPAPSDPPTARRAPRPARRFGPERGSPGVAVLTEIRAPRRHCRRSPAGSRWPRGPAAPRSTTQANAAKGKLFARERVAPAGRRRLVRRGRPVRQRAGRRACPRTGWSPGWRRSTDDGSA